VSVWGSFFVILLPLPLSLMIVSYGVL
jgi:hypothetical protein